MLTVSLLIEILRTRPRLIFWLAALTQTFLWVLVPSIFYSAPPGDVADVVAVGRELTFSASHGPPLAYWLAEFALRATGGHIFGIYLLSQICILVAYWAVFQLGRATIGDRHAVLAVLLMTGISVFTIGSPDFGPDILMMPLWALTLLHFWRATSEKRELYWLAVGLDICLMLLTSHLALVLVAALLVFIAMYPRARANIRTPGALVAGILTAFMLVVSIAVLKQGAPLVADFGQTSKLISIDRNLMSWLQLLALVVIAHAGACILIVLSSNLWRSGQTEAAAIARAPIDPYARVMIYYFALVPLVAMMIFAAITGKSDLASVAPLFVLSGLAIVVAGGDTILRASPARLERGLVRAADAAARARCGRRAGIARSVRGRSEGGAAGGPDRALFHGEFRTAHRPHPRCGGRRRPPRYTDRPRLREPAACAVRARQGPANARYAATGDRERRCRRVARDR